MTPLTRCELASVTGGDLSGSSWLQMVTPVSRSQVEAGMKTGQAFVAFLDRHPRVEYWLRAATPGAAAYHRPKVAEAR